MKPRTVCALPFAYADMCKMQVKLAKNDFSPIAKEDLSWFRITELFPPGPRAGMLWKFLAWKRHADVYSQEKFLKIRNFKLITYSHSVLTIVCTFILRNGRWCSVAEICSKNSRNGEIDDELKFLFQLISRSRQYFRFWPNFNPQLGRRRSWGFTGVLTQ